MSTEIYTPNPLDLCDHAKAHLIEMIMALHGRASTDPANYRRLLWGMGLPALRRALDAAEEGDLPPHFPAVSLTDNAGVIANDQHKGTVPDSSRETLTPKPSLP